MNAVAFYVALLSLPSPLEDLRRFPSHQVSDLNWQFARSVVKHLEKELGISMDTGIPAWHQCNSPLALNSPERRHLIQTLHEARFCRDCWQSLALATEATMDEDAVVTRLGELRLMLGEASWFAGEMPAVAPWWRFRLVGR